MTSFANVFRLTFSVFFDTICKSSEKVCRNEMPQAIGVYDPFDVSLSDVTSIYSSLILSINVGYGKTN